jgi:hypothetical protein
MVDVELTDDVHDAQWSDVKRHLESASEFASELFEPSDEIFPMI